LTQCEDKDCDAGYQCELSTGCKSYKVEREKLGRYQKDSSEFKKLLNKLRSQVCNKKLRKICCEVEEQELKQEKVQDVVKVEKTEKDSPSWIPNMEECGVTGNAAFILGGQDTKLGELPWMTLLGTRKQSGSIFWKCGGALINKWFVVSAAHCGPKVEYVRLGEWHVLDTDNYDDKTCSYYNEISKQKCLNSKACGNYCKKKNGNFDCSNVVGNPNENCAPEHQDIKVDRVINHPEYSKTIHGLAINDIMLLKLSKPAEFSLFVQPICLPDLDLTKLLGEPGHNSLNFGKALVAGWGRTYNSTADDSINIVSTPKQQKLEVPVLSLQTCLQRYKNIKLDLTEDISLEEHFCAGGEKKKDSCNGDSGGPLITRKNDLSSYMLVGVVSGGTSKCGVGAPGIYTRVSSYRSWILQNLL